MVSTLKLDELTKSTTTIYEAVMCIAKRARQINNDERAKMEVILGTDEQAEEEFEELPVEIHNQFYDRKIKPTRQAINELITGDMKIERFKEEEAEEKEEEKPAD